MKLFMFERMSLLTILLQNIFAKTDIFLENGKVLKKNVKLLKKNVKMLI